MSEQRVAVVIGAGPGTGAAVARRFAREGHAVACLARNADTIEPLRAELVKEGRVVEAIAADAADPASVKAAFERVRSKLGAPEVLVYNAGAFFMGGILEIPPEMFESSWRSNCFGAFLAAREVLPAMIEKKRGTILLTGATASLRGSARFAALAVGKFGLRAFAQSLAREFGPQGIHVAHVVIDGQIDTPSLRRRDPARASNTLLTPEAIADTYWQLHTQQPTAWSLELDLRPAVEKF
jgi:NAD(P)-dependent dehydrogenase (short-subunit alcohol dehydrogenase family)